MSFCHVLEYETVLYYNNKKLTYSKQFSNTDISCINEFVYMSDNHMKSNAYAPVCSDELQYTKSYLIYNKNYHQYLT